MPQTNGSLKHSNSRPELSTRRTDTFHSARSSDSAHLAPTRVNALARKDSSISEGSSPPDSLLDMYGTNRTNNTNAEHAAEKSVSTGEMIGNAEDPEHSRWIHRDKLARIESQELQAAGIILPRARATSKSSRREQSRDQQGNGLRSEQGQKRQRIESVPTEEEETEDLQTWDLRLPDEVADDPGDMYKELNGKQGVSRIPVCKTSPVPIPLQHLERDTPMKRKQSGGYTGEDEALSYAKDRGRSHSIKVLEDSTATPTPAKRMVSENSPTKKPARVTSTSGTRVTSTGQRPKTKGAPNRDVSGPRPTTRSGEIGGGKRPEGDPPWLASMYKPDPRLPPDEQLLPTVARRLQQEQWEKEGKFGNAYDTSFRPLNDEEFQQPPERLSQLLTPQPLELKLENRDSEWPLKGANKAPLSPRPGTSGTQTYSTMPKIQGIPQGVGPLPSPKPPIRLQQPPENTKKGCGCCVVM